MTDGTEITAEGEVKGTITKEPKGENGFGYDPIFLSDELGKTFAESSDEEKKFNQPSRTCIEKSV